MRDVIMKIMLVAIALSAISYFVATGLWSDSKTIRDYSHTSVNTNLAPSSP